MKVFHYICKLMNKIRYSLTTCLFLLLAASAFAQTVQRDSVSVFFRQGKSEFDPYYEGNARRLFDFTNKAKQLQRSPDAQMERVIVISSASPEGSEEVNAKLTYNRAMNILSYLRRNLKFDENDFEIELKDLDWERFEALVEADPSVPGWAEFRQAMRHHNLTVLQIPRWQKTWDYLLENIFPLMRSTTVVFEYKTAEQEPAGEPAGQKTEPEQQGAAQPGWMTREPVVVPPLPDDDEEPAYDFSEKRFWSMYVKTNLPAWALLDANLALEFEIGRHFSLSLPVYYSAADWFNVRDKFRVFGSQPEFRWWLRDDFSGLFVGLHGTVGLYNIATHRMDYRIQDRDGRTPAYGGGLNLGWKFRLDRARADRWGLELSVGYGYLHLDYDKFVNIKNGPWAGSFVEDYLGLDHASVAFTYRFGK